jgi:mono/diheme cytochrome c family protein
MKKLLKISALCIFIIAQSCGGETKPAPTAGAREPEPAAADPASTVFQSRCASCHGADGTAGLAGAANLQTSSLDSAGIASTISNGKGNMPPFKKTLTAEEISLLVSFVQRLQK